VFQKDGHSSKTPPGRSATLNSPSTPYNRGLHWFAVFIAWATFVLIVAGALVTSNDAGLSVPDWPTSFGRSPISYSYFRVPMVGGVKYEHGHRMIAEVIGLLTIGLAIWTWRTDRRPWMRLLGLAAVLIVVLQGVLGGITVLAGLPPVVSTAHATLGQAFFCIAVAIALFTGRRFAEEEPHIRFDVRHPSLPALAWASAIAILVQLMLGAMFRHHGMRLLPHIVMAAIVTVLVVWTIVRAISQFAAVDAVRRPALVLLSLVITQLSLGFAAYLTRVLWTGQPGDSSALLVSATVAHVSVGALLLATAVVQAIQASRHIAVLHGEPVTNERKAATA
jgi:cytochrome c oxidase assembly protein subunit 15